MSSASDQNKIENEEIYIFKLEFISGETLEIRMNSDEIQEFYDMPFFHFMKTKLTKLLNLDPDSEPKVKVINKQNENDISSLIVNESILNRLETYDDFDENDENYNENEHHYKFVVMIGYDEKIYDIIGQVLNENVTDVIGNVDKMNRIKRENGNVDFPSSREFIRRVIQDPEFRHEMYGTKKVVLPIVFKIFDETVPRVIPKTLERTNFLSNIEKYQQIWNNGVSTETGTGTGTGTSNQTRFGISLSRESFVRKYTKFGRGSEEKAHKKYNLFMKQFL